MQRVVEPEILDHLPQDDPAAIRSRRDLRMINFLMGNERWILRQALRFNRVAAAGGIAEFGSGEGCLAQRLYRQGGGRAAVECVDLAPRPEGLEEGIVWHCRDVLAEAPANTGLLVAGLFLHHFEGQALRVLGRWCEGFQAFCFAEPLRRRDAVWQGRVLFPLVNSVTRHDMLVSIRAGFLPGELPELLGLDAKAWRIEEQSTWRGGLRVVGWRV